jgi:hypothetical protein
MINYIFHSLIHKALIKNGVNMNPRDHRGQTPAHLV